MRSLVSREERLRRQPVGCWELLLVAEVLLVTPHVEQTGSGLSVACKALAGTFKQIAMRGFVMLLKELRRRPQLVGNTQHILGDSPAHSSTSYSSYERDNNIGKFCGIPTLSDLNYNQF